VGEGPLRQGPGVVARRALHGEDLAARQRVLVTIAALALVRGRHPQWGGAVGSVVPLRRRRITAANQEESGPVEQDGSPPRCNDFPGRHLGTLPFRWSVAILVALQNASAHLFVPLVERHPLVFGWDGSGELSHRKVRQ